MNKILRSTPLAATVLTLVACGDADTNDPRGYTKAPLEQPGWTVEREEPSEMAELGDPVRIPSLDTLNADVGGPVQSAAQPAPAAAQPAPGAQQAAPTPPGAQ